MALYTVRDPPVPIPAVRKSVVGKILMGEQSIGTVGRHLERRAGERFAADLHVRK
jgi:hypothetical protein